MKVKQKILKSIIIIICCVIALYIIIDKINQRQIKNNKLLKNNNSYCVELSPCGVVKFNKIPTKIFTFDQNWNDMLYALDEDKHIIITGNTKRFTYSGFYNQLGIKSKISDDKYRLNSNLSSFDKEFFYKINADVHHIDPYRLIHMNHWNKNDINEIITNIGPFFGNRYSKEGKYFNNNYKFYTLCELHIKLSEVYKKKDIAIKLSNFIKTFEDKILKQVKNVRKKPNVAIMWIRKYGEILPYRITDKGYGTRQYKILGVENIFEKHNINTYDEILPISAGYIDLESFVKVNPDIIIIPSGVCSLEHHNIPPFFIIKNLKNKKNLPLYNKINAIKNGKIYPGGHFSQGPIYYIFQLEMAAKQIYPEVFGKYRESNIYPKNEQLFSRKELQKILLEK